MKAILFDEFGGTEVLRYDDTPDPELQPDRVLVRIKATAMNRADILQRRGLYPPPPGEPDIIGLEMAGVVEKVGADVSGVEPGARVCSLLGGGGYAQYVAVPPELLMPIPDDMSFEQAAALPEALLTSYEALVNLADLQPGQTVLIHGAAGGVGTAAIQLAKQMDLTVIATAGSEEKTAFCRELGADHTVCYRTESFADKVKEVTGGRGVNSIYDVVGKPYWEDNIASLAIGGSLVVVGFMGGPKVELNLAKVLFKRLQILGLVMRSRPTAEKAAITRDFIERFWPAVESGAIKPVIDSTYELSEARTAHEHMEANKNIGKIVLTVE